MVYRWIGKAVVALSARYVKRKVSQRKGLVVLGVGVAAASIGVAAYLSSRDVPEG